MKTPIALLLALFLVVGCSKDSLEGDQSTVFQDGATITKASDVIVCHRNGKGEWNLLSVSGNALNGHINHGDALLEDLDGDGFVSVENDCLPGGDCDDLDPTVYPGAEELCGDFIDNNCDGQVDEGCAPDYSCPCFTYQEALDYAMATALEYKDEVCTLGTKGFTSSQGPFWGVTDLFFTKYCTDFSGNYLMLTYEETLEAKQLILTVQAEVQAAYCGD